jgi:hypothetical protein
MGRGTSAHPRCVGSKAKSPGGRFDLAHGVKVPRPDRWLCERPRGEGGRHRRVRLASSLRSKLARSPLETWTLKLLLDTLIVES